MHAYQVTLVTPVDVENGAVKGSTVYLHSQSKENPGIFFFITHPDSEDGIPLELHQVKRTPEFDLSVDDPRPVEEVPQAPVELDTSTGEVHVDPRPLAGPVELGRGAGLKYDAGKPRPTLLMRGCAWALSGVSSILAFGAKKYAADSWRDVENGVERYTDALMRHLLAWMGGEKLDEESGMPHLWHAATNLLFIIELTKGDYTE